MVIATGQVTKTINDARKNSFVSSYKMVIKEVKNRIAVGNDIGFTTDSADCVDNNNNCIASYDLSNADDYALSIDEDKNKPGYYKLVLSGNTSYGKFKNVSFDNPDSACPTNATCTGNTITAYINKTTGAVSDN